MVLDVEPRGSIRLYSKSEKIKENNGFIFLLLLGMLAGVFMKTQVLLQSQTVRTPLSFFSPAYLSTSSRHQLAEIRFTKLAFVGQEKSLALKHWVRWDGSDQVWRFICVTIKGHPKNKGAVGINHLSQVDGIFTTP
jgi:hypothetical protein